MILALVMFLASPDLEARILLENPRGDQFVERDHANRLWDTPALRDAMVRVVVAEGILSEVDAKKVFNHSFGASTFGLGWCRETLVEIRADKKKKRVID